MRLAVKAIVLAVACAGFSASVTADSALPQTDAPPATGEPVPIPPEGGDPVDKSVDATEAAIDEAKKAAVEAIEKAREAFKKALHAAKENAGPAIDKAKEATIDALEKAKKATSEVLDKAKKATEDALDAAEGKGDSGTTDAKPDPALKPAPPADPNAPREL